MVRRDRCSLPAVLALTAPVLVGASACSGELVAETSGSTTTSTTADSSAGGGGTGAASTSAGGAQSTITGGAGGDTTAAGGTGGQATTTTATGGMGGGSTTTSTTSTGSGMTTQECKDCISVQCGTGVLAVCGPAASCFDWLFCWNACSGSECYAACDAQYPRYVDAQQLMYTCICSHCEELCASGPGGCDQVNP